MQLTNERPLYRQVQDRLLEAILRGGAPAGTRLPSLRRLAKDLGVSRVTVEAAYEALEARGLVEARARSGTFVTRVARGMEPTGRAHTPTLQWEERIAPGPNAARERLLGQVLRKGSSGDEISFAWGAGDPRLFPVDAFRVILSRILRREGGAALGPCHTQGTLELREAFAAYLRTLDIQAGAEDVIVTSGSQQAIDLVIGALIRHGDVVAVGDPTWPGAIAALEAAGARIAGIPVDADGMRLEALARVLEKGEVRMIYTVPTHHNPTGAVMSAPRRQALAALARRHGVPVLEDDAIREVRFGAPLPPPLAALDASGNVIYVGSFTKSLLPAARLGYLVAPPALRDWAIARKRSMDLYCSPVLQLAMAEYLKSGDAARHWKRINRIYARRQRAMNEALARHMPRGAHWRKVTGGPVMWLRLPDGVSARSLATDAQRVGLRLAPGEAFFVEPADQPYLRLNFAALDEAQIEQGIEKLGALVRARTHREEQP